MKKRHIYRSSITGEIVTKEFALSNPDTTQKETLLNPKEITRAEIVKFCDFLEEKGRTIDYSLVDEYLKQN